MPGATHTQAEATPTAATGATAADSTTTDVADVSVGATVAVAKIGAEASATPSAEGTVGCEIFAFFFFLRRPRITRVTQ